MSKTNIYTLRREQLINGIDKKQAFKLLVPEYILEMFEKDEYSQIDTPKVKQNQLVLEIPIKKELFNINTTIEDHKESLIALAKLNVELNNQRCIFGSNRFIQIAEKIKISEEEFMKEAKEKMDCEPIEMGILVYFSCSRGKLVAKRISIDWVNEPNDKKRNLFAEICSSCNELYYLLHQYSYGIDEKILKNAEYKLDEIVNNVYLKEGNKIKGVFDLSSFHKAPIEKLCKKIYNDFESQHKEDSKIILNKLNEVMNENMLYLNELSSSATLEKINKQNGEKYIIEDYGLQKVRNVFSDCESIRKETFSQFGMKYKKVVTTKETVDKLTPRADYIYNNKTGNGLDLLFSIQQCGLKELAEYLLELGNE